MKINRHQYLQHTLEITNEYFTNLFLPIKLCFRVEIVLTVMLHKLKAISAKNEFDVVDRSTTFERIVDAIYSFDMIYSVV